MKDFSKPRQARRFRIDDDVFEAVSAIPAGILAEFAGKLSRDTADATQRFSIIVEALDLVLLPESFSLLRKRMSDKHDPVELDQLNDVIVWLLEEYGLRPTEPSPNSSGGQPNPEPGTSLTDGLQPGESISTLSPPPVS